MFGLHITPGAIVSMLIILAVLGLLVGAHVAWLVRLAQALRSSALALPARIGLFFLAALTPLIGFYVERAFRWCRSQPRAQLFTPRAIAMSGLGVLTIVLATIIREKQYAPGHRDWTHTLEMFAGLFVNYALFHAVFFMAGSLMRRTSGSVWSTRLHAVTSALLLVLTALVRWW